MSKKSKKPNPTPKSSGAGASADWVTALDTSDDVGFSAVSSNAGLSSSTAANIGFGVGSGVGNISSASAIASIIGMSSSNGRGLGGKLKQHTLPQGPSLLVSGPESLSPSYFIPKASPVIPSASSAARPSVVATYSMTGNDGNANSKSKPRALIESFIKRLLSEGHYVDARDIMEHFSKDIVGIRYEKIFQDFQAKSNFINSCIHVYQHSCYIRTYRDLESFILRSFKKYYKEDAADVNQFEDIGVGPLYKCDLIIELFRFDRTFSIAKLPTVSVSDILSIAQKFSLKHRFKGDDPSTIQENFDAELRNKLGIKYQTDARNIGIQVDFKQLFHKLIHVNHRQEEELKTFTEQAVTKYRTELRDKLSTLSIANKDQQIKRMFVADILRGIKSFSYPNSESVYIDLRTAFERVDVINFTNLELYFRDILSIRRIDASLLPKRKKAKSPESQPAVGAADLTVDSGYGSTVLIADADYLEYLGRNDGTSNLVYTQNSPAIAAQYIIALVRVLESSSITVTSKQSYSSDRFDSIMERLDSLKIVLNEIKPLISVIDSLIKSTSQGVAIEDLVIIREDCDRSHRELRDLYFKESHYVKSILLRASAMAATILIRLLLVQNDTAILNATNLTGEITEHLQSSSQKIRDSSSDESVTVPSAGRLVLQFLAKTEFAITRAKFLPAFESFNVGPFLGFLCRHESGLASQLDEFLSASFRTCVPMTTASSTETAEGNRHLQEKYSMDYLQEKLLQAIETMSPSSEPCKCLSDTLNRLSQLELELMCILEEQTLSFYDISGGNSFLSFLANSIDTVAGRNDVNAALSGLIPLIADERGEIDHSIMEYVPSSTDELQHVSVRPKLLPSRSIRTSGIAYLSHYLSKDLPLGDQFNRDLYQFYCDELQLSSEEAKYRTTEFMSTIMDEGLLERLPTMISGNKSILVFMLHGTDQSKPIMLPVYDLAEPLTEIHVNPETAKIEKLLLRMICMTPVGSSCSEYCRWADMLSRLLATQDQNPEYVKYSCATTLIDFIILHQEYLEMVSTEHKRVYVALSATDCMPLTTAVPTKHQVSRTYDTLNHATLASYLLSACLEITPNVLELHEDLCTKHLNQMANIGPNFLEKALDFMMRASLAVPPAVQYIVYDFLLSTIATSQGCAAATIVKSNEFERLVCRSLLTPQILGLFAVHGHRLLPGEMASLLEKAIDCPLEYSEVGDGCFQPSLDPVTTILTRSETAPSDGGDSAAIPIEPVDVTEISTATVAPRTDSKKAFIDRLLEERFSEDSDSAYGQMLQNALSKLSGELYSNEVHFLSELVQNADDNAYSKYSVPTLHMVLFPNALHVYNNELGFTEDNVSAISHISASTKTKTLGNIGQKGIGFKSVFSVSEAPEIHSNGFHIKFDRKFMVRPIWIDNDLSNLWPTTNLDGEYFETCIRLNFDERTQLAFLKLIENMEDVLDPRLMLFLNRLQKIVLHDKKSHFVREHTRQFLSENWIRISANNRIVSTSISSGATVQSTRQDSTAQQYWLIHKRLFKPTVSRTVGAPITDTVVAIAVKFSPELAEDDSSGKIALGLDFRDGNLPVYSFLPTKTALFKFVIQGDFNLISSRERLQEGNEWNNQLLSRVPGLFAQCVSELSQCLGKPSGAVDSPALCVDQITSAHSLCITAESLHCLLPIKSTSSEKTFCKLVDAIYAELQSIPFLRSSTGVMTKSSFLLSISHLNFDIRKVLPEDVLFQATGNRYLDPKFALFGEGEVGLLLRIRSFERSMAVDYLEKIASLVNTREASEEDLEAECKAYILEIQLRNRIRQDRKRWISTGILLVALLTLPNFVSNAPSSNLAASTSKSQARRNHGNSLIPSQVVVAQARPAKPHESNVLPVDYVRRIADLPIWCDNIGNNHSITKDVLWVASSTLSNLQNRCLGFFTDRILLLEQSFLEQAEDLFEGGKSIVRTFLLRTFKPNTRNELEPGGIDELNENNIMNNVILALYADKSCQLSRIEAAACLAFYFLSKGLDKLNGGLSNPYAKSSAHIGVRMPVLTLTANNSRDPVWHDSKVVCVRKPSIDSEFLPEDEIHLGPEFSDSATEMLIRENTCTTALAQLSWTIVDPLVAAFTLQDESLFKMFIFEHDQRNIRIKNRDIQNAFQVHETKADLRFFYLRLGVVNLFGIYFDGTDYVAPHLNRSIDWITQNGKEMSSDSTSDANTALLANIYFPTANCAGVLSVSNEVFATMKVFAKLIHYEIRCVQNTASAKQVAAKSKFSVELGTKKWFPIELDKKISKQLYALAAPISIFFDYDFERTSGHGRARNFNQQRQMQAPEFDLDRAIAWIDRSPHLLRVPPALKDLDSFQFFSFTESPIQAVELFVWATSQIVLFSSLARWRITYAAMLDYLNNTKLPPKATKLLKDILIADKPFLWIPSNRVESALRNISIEGAILRCAEEDIVAGTFYKLSEVTLKYPQVAADQESPFRLGPVIEQAKYYPEEDMFAVRKVCQFCHAIEGRFGARGKSSSMIANLSVAGRNLELGCSCIEKGFSCHIPTIGLMPVNPNLRQFLQTLIAIREKIENGFVEQRESYNTLMQTLSRNVWNTFNVANSLHPYCARELELLYQDLRCNRLLPAEDGTFVCYSETLLVVDDDVLFKHHEVQRLLRTLKWTYLPCIIEASVSDLGNQEIDYDLDRLRADERQLLALPTRDFYRCATTIQEKTFFAPSGMRTLYKFINVPCLSDFCTRQWNLPGVKLFSSQTSREATSRFNDFLHVVQSTLLDCNQKEMFKPYRPGLIDELTLKPRFQAILKSIIVEYEDLRESVEVALPGMLNEFVDLNHDHYFDLKASVIYLRPQLDSLKRDAFLSTTLINALRTEIAILYQNQCIDAIETVSKNLASFRNASSGRDPVTAGQFLRSNNLQNIIDLPGFKRWLIVDAELPPVDCVEADIIDSEPTGEEAERIQHSLRAFEIQAQKSAEKEKARRQKQLEQQQRQQQLQQQQSNSGLPDDSSAAGKVIFTQREELKREKQKIYDEIIGDVRDKGGMADEDASNLNFHNEHLIDSNDHSTRVLADPLAILALRRGVRIERSQSEQSIVPAVVIGDVEYHPKFDDKVPGRAMDRDAELPTTSLVEGILQADNHICDGDTYIDRSLLPVFAVDPRENDGLLSVPIQGSAGEPIHSENHVRDINAYLDRSVLPVIAVDRNNDGHLLDPLHDSGPSTNYATLPFSGVAGGGHFQQVEAVKAEALERFSTNDDDWAFAIGASMPLLADTSLDGSYVPLTGGISTGVLGERLAWHWLKRNTSQDESVVWVNERGEVGRPYDFVVQANLDVIPTRPARFVEVKSRLQPAEGAMVNQWFFSANELVAAQQVQGASALYSCLLISIEVELKRACLIPVGWKQGLLVALREKEAQLLIQVTKESRSTATTGAIE